ncbi:hypothetical protein BJX99DRAFT_222022 [Aspergillus californicus]
MVHEMMTRELGLKGNYSRISISAICGSISPETCHIEWSWHIVVIYPCFLYSCKRGRVPSA